MISYIEMSWQLIRCNGLNVKKSCFITNIYANVCFFRFYVIDLICGTEPVSLIYYITVN